MTKVQDKDQSHNSCLVNTRGKKDGRETGRAGKNRGKAWLNVSPLVLSGLHQGPG